ncbi:MAG: putative fluoride ion transporter CrcB [Candidatus Thorarchaeota archaeon]|nr:MAG: putative fluoride ion transporter CrcB [Candidatus Thorarchaeota archaeon]
MSLQIQKMWIVIGLAGVMGALSRWCISFLTEYILALPIFVDTIIVNVLGCFVLGLVLQMVPTNETLRVHMKDISAGFIGSFTTFSTFIADSYLLLLVSHPFIPGTLIMGHVLLGLIGFQLGLRTVKKRKFQTESPTEPTISSRIPK